MSGKKKTPAAEPTYHREQLMASRRWQHSRDVTMAVLAETTTYTRAQAEKLVSDFLKRKVK